MGSFASGLAKWLLWNMLELYIFAATFVTRLPNNCVKIRSKFTLKSVVILWGLSVHDPFPVDALLFLYKRWGECFYSCVIVNVSFQSCKHLVRCPLETCDRDLPCQSESVDMNNLLQISILMFELFGKIRLCAC